MSHLFGVGLDIEVKRINTQFKMLIQKKGGVTVRTLSQIFKQMDTNGNDTLNKDEFTQALASFGLFPKIIEIQALVKYYDKNGDGCISFQEFIKGLREPLNERRLKMVLKAFLKLDKNCQGKITMHDIEEEFDVTMIKDFIENKKSREEIIRDFIEEISDKKGFISKQDFVDYYTDLSLKITDDQYFVKMLESNWQIQEDEDATVTKEQIEYLVKTIRQKLSDFSNSNTDETTLRLIFKQFDTNRSGSLSTDEITAMLNKMQIACDMKFITALFKKLDRNQNGVIDFEEFVDFIVKNPYK